MKEIERKSKKRDQQQTGIKNKAVMNDLCIRVLSNNFYLVNSILLLYDVCSM